MNNNIFDEELSDIEVEKLSMQAIDVDLSSKRFKRKLWIYKLVSFQGNSIVNSIKASNNMSTLTVIDINKYVEFEGVPGGDLFSYDLTKLYDPNSIDKIQFKNVKTDIWVTQESKLPKYGDMAPGMLAFLDTDDCYVITKEKLSNDNFDVTTKFIVTNMDLPDGESLDLLKFGFNCIDINDWSDQMTVNPLIIINADPNVTRKKIKGITFQSPKGTFLSKLAFITKEGIRPPLMPDENTTIYPKIMFPFQVNPSLELLDWWNSNQFISFQEIFEFLDGKGIKYNEEFSLSEFLTMDDPGKNDDNIERTLNNVRKLRFTINSVKYRFKDGMSAATDKEYKTPFEMIIGNGEEVGEIIGPKKPYGELYASKTIYGGSKSDITGHEWDVISSNIIMASPTNVFYELETDPKAKSLFFTNVMLEMINFSYNLKRNFLGATKIEDSNEVIWKEDIYAYLKQAQDAGDAIVAITNIFDKWILASPETAKTYKGIIKRAKWVLSALSQDIVSNYSYNAGQTDDYKIVMPFYLDITNTLETTDIIPKPYNDIRVVLKSMYGSFTENKFLFEKKDMSKSTSFQLSTNLISFPNVGNTVEVSSIPSMNPSDVKLTDGEFYKYLVYKIATSDSYLKNYGTGDNDYSRYIDVNSSGRFIVDEENFDQIVIDGLQINGKWNIEIEFEDDYLVEFNVLIGNFSDETLGMYKLKL
jgi:hypothetical protein